jgi:hypothetical protein
MHESSQGKRIDVQSLLQEEADLRNDWILDSEADGHDGDQGELDALTAEHENLRRQVALLNARVAEGSERSRTHVSVAHETSYSGSMVIAACAALAVGILAAFSLKNR